MCKSLWLGVWGGFMWASAAFAGCTTYPNPLTDGTIAYGSQVITNLTYMSGCLAPLANPTFTVNAGVGISPTVPIDLYVSGDPGYTSGSSTGVETVPSWTSSSLTGIGNTYDSYFNLIGSSSVYLIDGYQANGGNTGSATLSVYTAFSAPQWPIGTVATNYGFKAGGAAGTNNYGVYVDSAKSYFGGNVGIGTTSPADLLSIYGGNLRLSGASNAGVSISTNNQYGLNYFNIAALTSGNGIALNNYPGGSGATVPYAFQFNTNVATSNESALLFVGLRTNYQHLIAVSNDGSAGHPWDLVFRAVPDSYNWDTTGYDALTIKAGATTNSLYVSTAGRVGINTNGPNQALEVNGLVQVDSLASASATPLCISANVLSSCSSSIRYKENVESASFGLSDVLAMRPVTFKWKGRDENDFGLIAEEVAKINPLFVTYKNGRTEGVKYPQLTAILINAVKELKTSNDQLRAKTDVLRHANASLMRRVETLKTGEGVAIAELQVQVALLKQEQRRLVRREARY